MYWFNSVFKHSTQIFMYSHWLHDEVRWHREWPNRNHKNHLHNGCIPVIFLHNGQQCSQTANFLFNCTLDFFFIIIFLPQIFFYEYYTNPACLFSSHINFSLLFRMNPALSYAHTTTVEPKDISTNSNVPFPHIFKMKYR